MYISDNVNTRQRVENAMTQPKLSKNFCLTWKNISYFVVKRRSNNTLRAILGWQQTERIQLLNAVSGVVSSGMLMAILGPSGAGKTTLLATISCRVKGQATGDILLNGEPIDTGQMIRISGFVPQKDLAVESLTVQEHMEFMARMKMDSRIRNIVRKQRIALLLAELGLTNCSTSILSSLSGGERKRVGLAVQLLTEPGILFCDEPTTGLDSHGAMTVVKTLRQVAATGRIVVCSLHQPASGLLDFFHEVVLLSGGRVAFQGSSSDAINFFDSLGLHCPPTFNSADFFISQLSRNRGDEAQSYQKINDICDQFEKSKYGEKVSDLIESSCAGASNAERHPLIFSETTYVTYDFKKVHTLTQVQWLTWRTFIDHKRNTITHFLRFITYMLIALLISSFYMGTIQEEISQSGIQNMEGLLYLVVVETIFTFNYAVFYTFPYELPLLLRDIASGLYSPAPYYLSKIVILIPTAIIQSFIYSLCIFVITGLKGGVVGFFYFTLPVILCAISSSALGCFLSASFKSIDTASLVSVPIDFLTLIFSGIFLHLGHLPPTTAWIKYLSQFYYGLEAVSLTQWLQIDHINCSPDPEEPCISSGMGVLDKYGYIADHYVVDLIGLLTIFAVCHMAGYIVIRQRSRKEPVY